MKKHYYLLLQALLFGLLFSFSACESTDCGCVPPPDDNKSTMSNTKLSWDDSTQWESDDFQILKVYRDETDPTVMGIDVAFSGGCEQHAFEIVWPEVITAIYPPDFSIVLLHDANGDSCEAYITETLWIDLMDTPLPLSKDEASNANITVINGSEEE